MRLEYSTVSNPIFAEADESAILCDVLFTAYENSGPLSFTARADDDATEHGPEIYQRCLAGEFGPVAPFVEIQPIKEQ